MKEENKGKEVGKRRTANAEKRENLLSSSKVPLRTVSPLITTLTGPKVWESPRRRGREGEDGTGLSLETRLKVLGVALKNEFGLIVRARPIRSIFSSYCDDESQLLRFRTNSW